MKISKCSGLDIKPPITSALSFETDDQFFKMHMLALFSGKRGGGKSVAVANLIRVCKERGYLDRLFFITPTFESNKEIWSICGVKAGPDVMEPTKDVLTKIQKTIELEADEWDRFLVEKADYERMHRDLTSGGDLDVM